MFANSRGFTLIELITTLSVIGILLGAGLPNLTDHVRNTRVKAASLSLLESIELTRTKAVLTNKRTTIQKRSSWENGWDIFVDSNNNGVKDLGEPALQTQAKINGVRVIANRSVANYISFIGSGEGRYANGTNNAGGFQAGTFTVCPTGSGKGYELILSRGGRVRQHEISARECAMI